MNSQTFKGSNSAFFAIASLLHGVALLKSKFAPRGASSFLYDGWIDNVILRLFQQFSVMSGRQLGDNERLCAVEPRATGTFPV